MPYTDNDVQISYEDGYIVIRAPYDGQPLALPVSQSGKSHLVYNARFKKVPGSPDPNLLISFSANSMIPADQRLVVPKVPYHSRKEAYKAEDEMKKQAYKDVVAEGNKDK